MNDIALCEKAELQKSVFNDSVEMNEAINFIVDNIMKLEDEIEGQENETVEINKALGSTRDNESESAKYRESKVNHHGKKGKQKVLERSKKKRKENKKIGSSKELKEIIQII